MGSQVIYFSFLMREHIPALDLIFPSLVIGYILLNKSNSLVSLGLDTDVMFVSKNSTENLDSFLSSIQNLGYGFLFHASPLLPFTSALFMVSFFVLTAQWKWASGYFQVYSLSIRIDFLSHSLSAQIFSMFTCAYVS